MTYKGKCLCVVAYIKMSLTLQRHASSRMCNCSEFFSDQVDKAHPRAKFSVTPKQRYCSGFPAAISNIFKVSQVLYFQERNISPNDYIKAYGSDWYHIYIEHYTMCHLYVVYRTFRDSDIFPSSGDLLSYIDSFYYSMALTTYVSVIIIGPQGCPLLLSWNGPVFDYDH